MTHQIKCSEFNNILYASLCFASLLICEFILNNWINTDYFFRISFLTPVNILVIFVGLVCLTFMGKWWRRASMLIIFLLTSVQWLSYQYFGTYIQPIQIIQLLPDFALISSSFFEVLSEMYGVFALMFFLGFLLFSIEMLLGDKLEVNWRVASFIVLFAAFDAQFVYRHLNPSDGKVTSRVIKRTLPSHDRLAIDNFYRSFAYLTYGILPKKINNNYDEAPSLAKPEIATNEPDVNVFFIINETVRASSLTITGYQEYNTTPLMGKIEELYAAPVYSASVMTRTSFAGLMHRMKHPWMGKQYTSNSNCLYKLAKENGFKTHFFYSFSLQSAQTIFPFMCSSNIDEVRTRNDYPKSLHGYDRNLFKSVEDLNFDDNNFVVIGLQGAHSPYARNVPPEFKKTNNHYINSLLYTDYSMDRLIKTIKEKSTKPAIIISTSDHGELLQGEGKLRGHGWLHEEIYTVPFIYLPVNMDKEILKTDVENVRSHFDVSTLVLKALGYDVNVEDNIDKTVYINGSDLNGLAGKKIIHIQNDQVISQSEVKSAKATPNSLLSAR